jgi:hypothetical protein
VASRQNKGLIIRTLQMAEITMFTSGKSSAHENMYFEAVFSELIKYTLANRFRSGISTALSVALFTWPSFGLRINRLIRPCKLHLKFVLTLSSVMQVPPQRIGGGRNLLVARDGTP